MWIWTLVAAQAQGIQADLHVDTPTQLVRQGLPFDAPEGLEAGLHQLQAGGTNLAVEVLWPPRNVEHWAHTLVLLERLEAEDARIEAMDLVRSPQEARSTAAAGHLGYLIALEGAHGLGADWKTSLDELHRRGLSMLGLTWSFSNSFAGSSGDGGAGLTEEGRALLDELGRRGIVVDLSHASRTTTLEVCGTSTVPVIASHSDAASLTPHARNLSDEEIRCIAETGGVIGVNFHASFVGGSRDVARVADHVAHLAKVGGYEAVALGSDFDGLIKVPKGLEDASQLGSLWAELEQRGWTEGQLAGLRGENFIRAWSAVLASAQP